MPLAGTLVKDSDVMLAAIVKSMTLPLFKLIVVVAEDVTAWRVLLVRAPAVTDPKLKTPPPFVVKNWPLVPSAVGYVSAAGLLKNFLTVPDAFSKYILISLSAIFSATSPGDRFALLGKAPDVVLR